MPGEKPLTEVKVDLIAGLSHKTKEIIPGVKEAPSAGVASYESVNYSLKLIADTLGIENKEFMALQFAPVATRLSQMKDTCSTIIEFIDE